jgi:hypothetical protein
MSDKRISIDELLNEQSNPSLQATVEKIEGNEDLVKVTPWTASGGCLCHLAINIPKASLEGATATGNTHVCCGKSLRVVELHFKKDHKISLEDLFQQIQTKSARPAQHTQYLQRVNDDGAFQSRVTPHRRGKPRQRVEVLPLCLRLLIEESISCFDREDVGECLYVAGRNYEGCMRLE